jgi:hypothetical protein
MKKVLWVFQAAGAALLISPFPCAAATVTPSRTAFIVYCLNSFATGPCTLVAHSSGAAITGSGTVNTSGESVTFTASSVSRAGALGGSVSLTSNTLNSSGPGVMVNALQQLVDIMTISFDPFNGSTGYMELLYTLQGTNSATGTNATATFGPHRVPYACIKMGINDPVFPLGCVAYDQPGVNGIFSAGVVPFIYGTPFPLWFQLESIAGTGFGPGRPTGTGTSAANFFNTATIGGFILYDPDMKPLNGTPEVTSALGIPYQVLSVARQVKTAQPTALMALLPTGSHHIDHDLSEAIRRINASLAPHLWIDDLHLTRHGKRVFREEREAVEELSEIRNAPASLLEALGDVARTLTLVDRALAKTALDEAKLAGGDAEELAWAEESLARGDEGAGQGQFAAAIERYKHAWQLAQRAIHCDTDGDEREDDDDDGH